MQKKWYAYFCLCYNTFVNRMHTIMNNCPYNAFNEIIDFNSAKIMNSKTIVKEKISICYNK